MTDLLQRATSAVLAERRSVPPSVEALAGRVRRRRQRRRGAVATVVALAAVVGLGALTLGDGDGVPADDPLESVVVSSGALVPSRVPDGFRLDSVTVQGPRARSYDSSARLLVLVDPIDPNRAVRLHALSGSDRSESARQFQPIDVPGATTAAYGVSDGGVVTLVWSTGVTSFSATAHGITFAELRSLAAGASLTNGRLAATSGVPDGLTIAYEGPWAEEGPRIGQAWRTSDGPWLDVTLVGSSPWTPPVLQNGTGTVVRAGRVTALYYDSPVERAVTWLDGDGNVHAVVANGLEEAALLDVVASLVPLDPAQWRRLRRSVTADRVQNFLDGAAPAGAATTAVALPSSAPRPSGFRATDLTVADVPLGHRRDVDRAGGDPLSGVSIVHTTDDRWVAITTSIDPGRYREGCQADPIEATDGTLTGWTAPCTGVRYAPDGQCADDRCVVGLRTVEVRIVDGRIEIDPDAFRLGASPLAR